LQLQIERQGFYLNKALQGFPLKPRDLTQLQSALLRYRLCTIDSKFLQGNSHSQLRVCEFAAPHDQRAHLK